MPESGKALSSTDRSRRRRSKEPKEPTQAQAWHKRNKVDDLVFQCMFCDITKSRRTFYRRRRYALSLFYLEAIGEDANLARLAEYFNEEIWHFLLAPEWRRLRKRVGKIEPRLMDLMRPDHFSDPGWADTGQPDGEWRQPVEER